MSEQELVQEILDYIKTTYKAEYTGLLEVSVSDTLYSCTIGIPSYMSPTTISCEASSDDEFLSFIKQEFLERNYMRLYIYKVVKEDEKH